MPDPAVAATTVDPNADPNADLDPNSDAPPAEGDDTAAEGDPNPEPDPNQPAPRATATSEAPPEPDGKPPTKEEEDALILESMAAILEISGETPPAPAPEDKPGDKPGDAALADPAKPPDGTATPPATPPVAPQATPPKKRVTFELPKELDEEEPPAPVVMPPKPTLAKPATPPTTPTVDADMDYIRTLPEEAQDQIVMAQMAERAMAAKYPGQGKKLVTYFRQVDDLVNRMRTARPERSFGDDDEEYKAALAALEKTKPVIARPDSRTIERQMIRHEVKEEVVAEMAPKLSELDRKTRALQWGPKVEEAARKIGENIRKMLPEAATNDAVRAVLKEIDSLGDKAKDDFALELDIISDRIGHAQNLVSEYAMIRREAAEFDPGKLTPLQEELNEFIVAQGEAFLRTGGKRLVNAHGQRFIPMPQMHALKKQVRDGQVDPAELHKVWTFGDNLIYQLIGAKAQAEIESQISYEMERNKKYGLTRQKKAAEPAKAPTVEPPKPQAAAPKARPRPSIGPGTKTKPNVPGEADIHSIYADQGFET